jgi:uncharacterized protein YacL
MSVDFVSRIIGMVVFMLLSGRLGVNAAASLGLPSDLTSFIFILVGVLAGLILTPWLTVRPVRFMRKMITEMPVENLVTAFLGLIVGLLISLLAAYPLSLLASPFGTILPAALAVVGGYLGMAIFTARASEIWSLLGAALGMNTRRGMIFGGGERQLLLDTSVLIDGRVVDIAKTGFLGGTLVVPRFVIAELHQVADSSDALRRARGRNGLNNFKALQQESSILFKIVEDDVENVREVDDKLVALALQLNASIVTNDYPLNSIAQAQGVPVLNINVLANAVRAAYLPGEIFPLRVIQEGKEQNQGVGYLDDGTMVVVEGGKTYMDRTIRVEVTKFINQPTGRMYFARPEKS